MRAAGCSCEPYLLDLLSTVLERASDKQAPVRTAAENAAAAFVDVMSPYTVEEVLPQLFDGMQQVGKAQGSQPNHSMRGVSRAHCTLYCTSARAQAYQQLPVQQGLQVASR